jgi:iron(III) transport system substrate-binding protein
MDMFRLLTKLPIVLALLLLNVSTALHAQAQNEAATYEGADRDQRLLAAARKEGALVLYTSVNRLQHDSPIIKAFQQKYGIKVTVWRAGSEKLLQRVMTEAQARRYEVDAITFTGSGLESLRREKLLQEVKSPIFDELIPSAPTSSLSSRPTTPSS